VISKLTRNCAAIARLISYSLGLNIPLPLLGPSGHQQTRTAGTKSSARHRSLQPIIIVPKGAKVLKSLWENLGDFRPQRGPNYAVFRPRLLVDQQSYANLINSPARPKHTNAAPRLSSDSATMPVAKTHIPTVTSISVLPAVTCSLSSGPRHF
jgi:hypothetical protein